MCKQQSLYGESNSGSQISFQPQLQHQLLNPGFLDDKKSLTMAEIGAIEPNHEIPNPTLECLGHPSLMVGELSTPFMYRIDALFDILIDRIEKQVPYQFQNYHENESCYLTYVR